MTPADYAAAKYRGEEPDEPICSPAANRAWAALYATGSWELAVEMLREEKQP